MNVSYRWLRTLAPELSDSPDQIADRLAMYGAPVEETVRPGEALGDLVIGRVERVREHPNADRLRLCDVDAGGGETVQVVCGAPVIHEGAYYPFIPVGGTLPGGVEIRKAKLRGEVSHGMLCSERELGLGRDDAGILELRGEFTPGESFVEAVGLDDVRLTLEITPNRPDLLSHVGVARELAPRGHAGVRLPAFPGPDAERAAEDAEAMTLERVEREGEAGGVRVRIEDPRGCPRYMGAVIRGVEIGPSPEWLASRLRAIGLRPINNVVDATNYVLHETGQPLHAFDLDRLGGDEVVIRRADAGETIVTLDGERRTLEDDMVVIADAERPQAVAGVMGGDDSEVGTGTRDIFLECALFDPKSVRRTRGALGLSTDASYRFERGVDPEGLEPALRRVVSLILTLAGGDVDGAAVDVYPEPAEAPVVVLRPARASKVLGADFDADAVVGYLEPLGFAPVERDGDAVRFRVPGYRWYDVEREADLIEEVARRHGYDRFGDELRAFRPSAVPDDPFVELEASLRAFFAGRGFLEARTLPFVPEAEGDVALLLPLSKEESRLRRSLAPGLVRRIEYNFARGARDVRLYEVGTVFAPASTPDDPPVEATRVAAVLTGARAPSHWTDEVEPVDVWDLKTVLVDLADVLGLDASAVEPGGAAEVEDAPAIRLPFVEGEAFHVANDDGRVIGVGGRVPAEAVDAPAWAEAVWALEITLDPAMAVREPVTYRPLPTQPAIERDLALLVPVDRASARAEAVIRERAGEHLEAVYPFDLYRGRGVPAGTRSIAYRLRFRALDRTLEDREADEAVRRILQGLSDELGIERRG